MKGPTAIEALIEKYPEADRQQLRNLQRQASRELAQKKSPTAGRKIFAYLRELSEINIALIGKASRVDSQGKELG